MRHSTSWRLAAGALMLSLLVSGVGPSPSEAEPVDQLVAIGPSPITVPPMQVNGRHTGQCDAVGRLTTIAVNPVDLRIIYPASAGQLGHEGSGIWKTTNGSGSWTPITDHLSTLSVGALAIDPGNPDHVYPATTDEGLFHSIDAGARWDQLDSDLRLRSNTSEGLTTTLTYWGAHWSNLNVLSDGAAPSAFKGFASTLTPLPPACGARWSTAPGNYSTPVASIPAYMGVAVSSRVTRTGSLISGDTVKIVVIRINPGYAPDQGQAGTRTLVATYCTGHD